MTRWPRGASPPARPRRGQHAPASAEFDGDEDDEDGTDVQISADVGATDPPPIKRREQPEGTDHRHQRQDPWADRPQPRQREDHDQAAAPRHAERTSPREQRPGVVRHQASAEARDRRQRCCDRVSYPARRARKVVGRELTAAVIAEPPNPEEDHRRGDNPQVAGPAAHGQDLDRDTDRDRDADARRRERHGE